MPQSAARSLSKPLTYRRSRPILFSHSRSAFDRDPAPDTDRGRARPPFAVLFHTPKAIQCPPITPSAELALAPSGTGHCAGTNPWFFPLLVDGRGNDPMAVSVNSPLMATG